MPTIRLELPDHLRNLARVGREVSVTVEGEVTLRSVLDALEAAYPMLRGTIRDQTTGSGGPYSGSLPANATCRTSPRRHPSPRRSSPVPSRC